MPRRIQLSRRKGWRKPDNTVVVARPSRWGNPYAAGKDGVIDRAEAVRLYRAHQDELDHNEIRRALAGKNLACWCRLDQPCHADVLLEIANPADD
jgi:hypothetical protein